MAHTLTQLDPASGETDKLQRRGRLVPPSWALDAEPLTSREHECLQLLVSGLRSAEVAGVLGISQSTLNAHLASARRKLGVCTTCHAVIKTMSLDPTGGGRAGSVDPEPAALLAGAPRLSRREREALHLVMGGFAVAEMAKRLKVSVRSAEKFLAGARSKLGARNNAQAVYRAMVFRALV